MRSSEPTNADGLGAESIDAQTVGALGEAEVLRRILARLSPAEASALGPGDDSAVLRVRGDAVVTTDTMVEGPDFRLAWHDGFALGWKLAASNLSDVAAMGARPTALTAALACPAETPVALLERIAEGLDAACRELASGCGVIGGDLGRAPVLTAAITALGELDGRAAITRSGARPGDTVAYAGRLGLAGLGLSMLFSRSSEGGVAHSRGVAELRAEHPAAIAAQLTPRPPIGLGEAIARGAASDRPSAMLDVSDGLALDATRLARASGVTIELDAERLLAGFGTQEGESVPLDAMLFGGEDHGLLATFPPGAELPAGFHAIGTVTHADAETALLLDGEPCESRGWDPFRALP